MFSSDRAINDLLKSQSGQAWQLKTPGGSSDRKTCTFLRLFPWAQPDPRENIREMSLLYY